VINLKNQALLLIDLQTAIFDPADPVYQAAPILTKVQSLIQLARNANLLLIYI